MQRLSGTDRCPFSWPSASICSLHCCPGQIHCPLPPLAPAGETLLSPRWVTLPPALPVSV